MPLSPERIAELDQHFANQSPDYLTQVSPDKPVGMSPERVAQLDQLFAKPQVDTGTDIAKSVGSNLVGGGIDLAMMLPNMLNQAVAGPQELYRGIRDTFQGNKTDNSPMWQPFFGSGDVERAIGTDYQPQTVGGKIATIPARLVGGIAGAKAVDTVGNSELMKNQSSGTPLIQPNQPLPDGMQNLDVLPAANKGTMFAKKPNPLEVGLDANQKISAQFGKDTELQRNLYADVNSKGKVFSIKASDLYNKLDDMIGYLDGKVAVDTPEYRTLTELKEFKDSLSAKYGIGGTPDKTMQLPSWKQPMVTQKGTPGQAAYGIEPSDLIDLKTAINSGLKPNKFSNAGSAKILQFKQYVQSGLNEASKLSPEFAGSLKAAETQAARVGMYKEDSLKTLWQPEDYVSWKSGGPIPADTQSRAAKFLENVNNKAIGRASSIANILPKDDVQSILRSAILHGKTIKQNVPLNKSQAKNKIISMVLPDVSPLQELAVNISKMQRPLSAPIPQVQPGQNATTQGIASILMNLNNRY